MIISIMDGLFNIVLMLVSNAVGITMLCEHENKAPIVLLSLLAIADGYVLEYFGLMTNLYA